MSTNARFHKQPATENDLSSVALNAKQRLAWTLPKQMSYAFAIQPWFANHHEKTDAGSLGDLLQMLPESFAAEMIKSGMVPKSNVDGNTEFVVLRRAWVAGSASFSTYEAALAAAESMTKRSDEVTYVLRVEAEVAPDHSPRVVIRKSTGNSVASK